ncbi:S8 family serine peptidase [Streptomyces sp. NPDC049879]|uniref:S8 family serine peptidase n=1 Tax=Streptomyces sp. NPDC049879 TaxID=3365598 RepID=UPI0037A9D2F6
MTRSIRRAAVLATSLALAAGAAAPAMARPPEPAGTAAALATADAAPGRTATVRLVTGDTVTVTTVEDGRQVATPTPGPGRDGVAFQTVEEDGRLTVLPSDAWPLIASGTVDPGLFDVSALIEQGYDTAHTDSLPLIVLRPQGVSASAVGELTRWRAPGEPSRELDSIDATSVRVPADDLDDFWHALAPAPGTALTAARATLPRVRLDARVTATLDRSTAQINAPAAWDAGYRGEGVTVAVLDTGADADHPDLAGRVAGAEDFSGSGGTHDAYGHGTHVAATVGGSGAGAGGSRPGVAPAADLLVGKVLGDDGTGSESDVIAGMEWAVAQGADVVNMSLGSDTPSDGTDPMSLALDTLAAETGTLFVVAAGNTGENGRSTVGSPGAAAGALTVGAVDRDDELAPFSSRGPLPGDAAVKPDVTAPGVGIVAARASGTGMGTPVDALYTAASGTSMATPHVAGAAALLAQQHPDWNGERIKDALVSTAVTRPGTPVTDQGGGRIDLAAAVLGGVTATGTVALGPFSTDDAGQDAEPVTLTYTNTSTEPVTLTLDTALATNGGQPLPSGALTLDASTVRVEPGGHAEATLTADPARAPRGDWYGYVRATAPDGTTVAHTTVSLAVNGPQHTLTPTVIDQNGEPRPSEWPLIKAEDGFVVPDSTSPLSAEVEEGTYTVADISDDGTDPDDGLPQLRAVYLPEVNVTDDREIVIDRRAVTPVEIRTPRPAEQRNWASYQIFRELDGRRWTHSVAYPVGQSHLLVSPTRQVTRGTFEFASRWQLVAPLLTGEVHGGRGTGLTPYYLSVSSLLPRDRTTLTAVDAGSAARPDFSRARGALAVIRDEPEDYFAFTERARAAGAAAVVTVAAPDQTAWSRWRPNDSTRTAVPLIRVSHEEGTALLERAAARRTTVTLDSTPASPYLYDVMQVSSGRIPDRVVHTVGDGNTAEIRTTYAEMGGSPWASAQRIGWRPHQGVALLDSPRDVMTGTERTEYVSSGDTQWQHFVHHTLPYFYDIPVTDIGLRGAQRTYGPRDRLTESWFAGPVRPAAPEGTGTPGVREGDTMALRVPEFTDADGHWGRALDGDRVSLSLHRDGTEIGRADEGYADIQVPPGTAGYRLDLATERADASWALSTATETSWWFRSRHTDTARPLPLLQLDYDLGADAAGTVRHRSHTVDLRVRRQDGPVDPDDVTLRVEASWDGGGSFVRAERIREQRDGTFRATLERPRGVRGDVPVTLRVTARDDDGNQVRQTVTGAYLHQG